MAVVYVSGELLDAEDAQITVFDHGLVTGDGVFETVLLRSGRPFALRRHLDRLERSAKSLGVAPPSRSVIEDAVEAVVAADGPQLGPLGRLRITLTSGRGPLASPRGNSPSALVIAAEPFAGQPPTEAVAVVPWPRNERGALAGLKTTSYAENVIALAWARERGAGEAILGNTVGNLCEGTGSNIFVVVDGHLMTPPLRSGPLAGTTRDLVLAELAGGALECTELDLPIEQFAAGAVDEAFLTSTTRCVQPVHAIDGLPLAAAPGPITRVAADLLAALMAKTDDP